MTMEKHAGPGGPGDPFVPKEPPSGRRRGRHSRPSGRSAASRRRRDETQAAPPPVTGPATGPVTAPGTGPMAGPVPGGHVPGSPRAGRGTTIALVLALVVVVLTAGVLGTIAVLMTRDPDVPLGAAPPRRLAVPIHFAPVTGTQPGPCTDPDLLPDDQGKTCYTIAAGVSVNAVRAIETVQERSGAYSVRIAFAPAFRDQINDLTQEAVRQQIAIVVGERVVAAPRVAQVITHNTLSIEGSFTREQADGLVARLTGSAGTPDPVSSVPPGTGESPPGTGESPAGTGGPAVPLATGTPGDTAPTPPTGAPRPAVPAVTTPPVAPRTTPRTAAPPALAATAPPAAASGGGDPRYPDCATAVKNGYGPYFRETHRQYGWYVDKDGDGVACDPGDI
ncbi:hypothetical protein GCM10017673_03500 [Streptosporangium violaceochromogenes]|nr:hypothetical protein GCM10017673_03500 [Streptosporangium violaceochromogenes]